MTFQEVDGDFEPGRSGPNLKLILFGVLLAGLVTFFFQNGNDAEISFLWLDATWPIWAVIGVSVLLGVILDRLGSWQWRRARARGRAEDD